MKSHYLPVVLLFTLFLNFGALAQGSANNTIVTLSPKINLYPYWSKCLQTLLNLSYDYDVTLKDASVIEVKSKIYIDTAQHKCYLLYTNKELKKTDPNRIEKIYPEETIKISRTLVTGAGFTTVNGLPAYGCWLFKVMAGHIDAFSPLAEIDDIDSRYLLMFKPQDGSMQKLDSLSLSEEIQDSPAALKALKKRDLYEAIRKFNQ